jgi:Cu-Zn family superoxide dismutase
MTFTRTFLSVTAALGMLAGTALAQSKPAPATVELKDKDGKTVGKLTLKEAKGGVAIKGKLMGLTPGQHGFHIHEKGACTPPGFQSAGGHYNPTKKHHGQLNPQGGQHVGDLGNLNVGPKGTIAVNTMAKGATLGKGDASLTKTDGTAIVVHAKADDLKSDPAGNAGDRIACGPIAAR